MLVMTMTDCKKKYPLIGIVLVNLVLLNAFPPEILGFLEELLLLLMLVVLVVVFYELLHLSWRWLEHHISEIICC